MQVESNSNPSLLSTPNPRPHILLPAATPTTAIHAMQDGNRCPSLRELCLEYVEGARISLDNVLAALELSHTHDIPDVRRRALQFLSDSWKGVRARHARPDLEAVLGSELLTALEREQAELDTAVRKLKTRGDVIQVSPTPSLMQAHGEQIAQTPIISRAIHPRQNVQEEQSNNHKYGGGYENCVRCGGNVYLYERLRLAPSLVFHQACFRCAECSCKLEVHNFELSADKDTVSTSGPAGRYVPLIIHTADLIACNLDTSCVDLVSRYFAQLSKSQRWDV